MTELQGRHCCVAAIMGVLMMIGLSQAAGAQEIPVSSAPKTGVIPGFAQYSVADRKSGAPVRIELSVTSARNTEAANPAGPRRITLDEAQQEAAAAANPMFRLAKLGVEAARQHRLGVQSDYFPKLSSTFANFHFNKLMGELVQFRRPILGTTATFAVPVFNKDETLVAATVMQPVTPLFKLHQVVKIARADERIARAKAGMPGAEVANQVDQAYFGVLVAERQREAAEANVRKVENKWRLASTSTLPAGVAEHETEWLEVSKALVLASSKVKEATASLNALLGWPLDTELTLTVPAAFYENVSAPEATELAMQNNPEVIEAEQTVVKARAATRLSKLDYVPDVAIVGGYAYQSLMPSLPNDFSYVGVMGNYTLFDFGKRERTVKERNAQLAMAETGVLLVKAKVAAGVTKAYFELDRSRQLTNLARRLNSANRAVEVKYDPEEARAARAKSEAEMLQTELEYRMAFFRLQRLIGTSSSR